MQTSSLQPFHCRIVTPVVFKTISIKGPRTDQDTTGFDYANISKKLKYVLPYTHYATTLDFAPGVYMEDAGMLRFAAKSSSFYRHKCALGSENR